MRSRERGKLSKILNTFVKDSKGVYCFLDCTLNILCITSPVENNEGCKYSIAQSINWNSLYNLAATTTKHCRNFDKK